jgi:hypothetical protein
MNLDYNLEQAKAVFDKNLLPVPFNGMIVTAQDVNSKPTAIDFYQNAILSGSTMTGKKVMTMTLLWDAVGNFLAAATQQLVS